MIKTILVATDGSSHAGKAIDLATDIGAKYQARLVLLNVITGGPLPASLAHMVEVEHIGRIEGEQPVAPVPEGKFPASMHTVDKAEGSSYRVHQFLAQKILSEAEKVSKSKGITDIRNVIKEGDPARSILDLAKEENADLIVMGSRGLGGLKGLLVGSVSHKVSQLSTCSVITVK